MILRVLLRRAMFSLFEMMKHLPVQLGFVLIRLFHHYTSIFSYCIEFMTRVQMDLIDMRTRSDAHSSGKVYNWIIQLKDHFSKFCWARPLQKKEAREVYQVVREIFFMFGPPRILQSDNGREFVNDLINGLQSDFPGDEI